MSTPDDLYRPPKTAPPANDGGLSAAEWQRGAKILAGGLIGGSLLLGVVDGVRAGLALRVFGAEAWLGWLVACGAIRRLGAGVASSAVAVTVVAMCHRRAAAKEPLPRTRSMWPVFAALPLVTPIATCLIIAAVFGVASLGFDVPVGVSWARVREHVIPVDAGAGMAMACLLTLLLGAAVRGARRLLATTQGGLIARVLVVVVATQGMASFVNDALWGGSSSGIDPGLQNVIEQLGMPRH